jgi:hypothetical protein
MERIISDISADLCDQLIDKIKTLLFVLQIGNQYNESLLMFDILLKIISGFLLSCEFIDCIAMPSEILNLIYSFL